MSHGAMQQIVGCWFFFLFLTSTFCGLFAGFLLLLFYKKKK